jgi:hypothetical protein
MRDALAAELPRTPTLSAGSGEQQWTTNSLYAVDYAVLPAGRVAVKFTFRNEIKERPPVIVGYHLAANIVLDFADTVSELPKESLELGHRVARNIRILTVDSRTRAVINLNRPVSYDITTAGREVLLTLEPR